RAPGAAIRPPAAQRTMRGAAASAAPPGGGHGAAEGLFFARRHRPFARRAYRHRRGAARGLRGEANPFPRAREWVAWRALGPIGGGAGGEAPGRLLTVDAMRAVRAGGDIPCWRQVLAMPWTRRREGLSRGRGRVCSCRTNARRPGALHATSVHTIPACAS